MLRYIAFMWDPGNQLESETASELAVRIRCMNTGWKTAIQIAGCHLYWVTSRPEVGTLSSRNNYVGAVLGVLFKKIENPHGSPRVELDAEEMERIAHSGGTHLIEHYWGWYVAFFRDPESGTHHVMRGPSSDLPCFHTRYRGLHVFFSRIADCTELNIKHFTVDWEYLCFHLAHKEARGPSTALCEVTEVEVGERMTIRSCVTARTYIWHPCKVAKTDSIGNDQAAQLELQRVARSCVRSWATAHAKVLHRLSGGLDSSIALACMTGACSTPRITCITLHSAGQDDDERRYARLVAARVKCRLLERQRNPKLHLDVFRHLNPIPRPRRDYSAFEAHRALADIATELGATAVLSGAQGDNLFQQSGDTFAAEEYVSRYGIGPSLLRVVSDAAQLSRVSVWKKLRQGVSAGLFGRPSEQWDEYLDGMGFDGPEISMRGLLTDAATMTARDARSKYRHPWYDDATHVPRAKLWMISQMNAEMDYNGQFALLSDPVFLGVFISQPLVELCLRIETHLTVRDGMERSVARRAFAGELPREVVMRSGKGGPDAWMKDTLCRNVRFLREFLLDGVLVKERLLDREMLEDAISLEPRKSRFTTNDVVTQLYNEAWVRNWVGSTNTSNNDTKSSHTTTLMTGPDKRGTASY